QGVVEHDEALVGVGEQALEIRLQLGGGHGVLGIAPQRRLARHTALAAGKGVIEQEDVEILGDRRIEEALGGGMLDMAPGDVLAEAVQHAEQVFAVEGMVAGNEQHADRTAAALIAYNTIAVER